MSDEKNQPACQLQMQIKTPEKIPQQYVMKKSKMLPKTNANNFSTSLNIPQCTMGQAMEIDILEVCKRKNYYTLIFY